MAKVNAELKEKIESAFADVPYPGDENIGSPDGRDDGERLAEGLRGRNWRSLEPDELWPSDLGFVTNEAFHYYFPAYLLASYDEDSGDIIDSVFWQITPPEQMEFLQPDPLSQARFDLKFRRFTPVQKSAIRDFINWALEELLKFYQDIGEPIDEEVISLQRLKDYWDHF